MAAGCLCRSNIHSFSVKMICNFAFPIVTTGRGSRMSWRELHFVRPSIRWQGKMQIANVLLGSELPYGEVRIKKHVDASQLANSLINDFGVLRQLQRDWKSGNAA
jgi:hypothetical protein